MKHAVTFYTYLHARPATVDAHGVFYVGKGQRDRFRDFSHRNPHHKNVVVKHGAENILIGRYDCSTEDIAMDLEKGLIKRLKAMGVELTNYTDGGEGMSGLRHTETTKEKMRQAGKLRPPPSEEVRRRTSSTVKRLWSEGVFRGVPHTEEARRKISENALGRPNPSARVPKSPETIAKISATKLAKPIVKCPHCEVTGRQGGAMSRYHFDNCRPEERARKERAKIERKPRTMSPENREAARLRWQTNNPSSRSDVKLVRSVQSKRNWNDPEIRARASEGMKAAWTEERKAKLRANNPSHRADVNAKKSVATKGRPQRRVVCPHCSLEGGLTPMIRYHFGNCKDRKL